MWAQAAPTPFPVPCLWCYEVTCLAHVTLLVQVLPLGFPANKPLGFPANKNVNRLLFYDKNIRRHVGKESRAVPRCAMAGDTLSKGHAHCTGEPKQVVGGMCPLTLSTSRVCGGRALPGVVCTTKKAERH